MHELSIAMNILQLACQEVEKNHGSHIESIHIDVGELAGVLIESLSFCFDTAKKETLAEHAKLNISIIPGKAQCSNCHAHFNAHSFISLCPQCESYSMDIIQGKELQIKSIQIGEGTHHV